MRSVQVLSLVAIAAFLAASPEGLAREISVSGVKFEKTTPSPSGPLPLRGATLCRYWGFKVYTAAFYVDPQARSLEEILGLAPKRLVLYYNRSIDREDLVEATEQALRRNPDVNLPAIRTRLDRLYRWFEDVDKGDRFRLDYIPGEGSTLYFNGRPRGVIEGEDFARALFGVWLSDYSLNEDYRDRLLGGF